MIILSIALYSNDDQNVEKEFFTATVEASQNYKATKISVIHISSSIRINGEVMGKGGKYEFWY